MKKDSKEKNQSLVDDYINIPRDCQNQKYPFYISPSLFERQREHISLPPVAHSPNTCHSHGSVRLKPGAWRSLQVSHMGGKASRVPEHICWELDQKQNSGDSDQHSNTNANVE